MFTKKVTAHLQCSELSMALLDESFNENQPSRRPLGTQQRYRANGTKLAHPLSLAGQRIGGIQRLEVDIWMMIRAMVVSGTTHTCERLETFAILVLVTVESSLQ
jgi:hypothetical protein